MKIVDFANALIRISSLSPEAKNREIRLCTDTVGETIDDLDASNVFLVRDLDDPTAPEYYLLAANADDFPDSIANLRGISMQEYYISAGRRLVGMLYYNLFPEKLYNADPEDDNTRIEVIALIRKIDAKIDEFFGKVKNEKQDVITAAVLETKHRARMKMYWNIPGLAYDFMPQVSYNPAETTVHSGEDK